MTHTLLFINNIGITEWIIILVIVLVLFGGKKIPQLAKDLGMGIREFKNSMTDTKNQIQQGVEEPVQQSYYQSQNATPPLAIEHKPRPTTVRAAKKSTKKKSKTATRAKKKR